MCAIAFNEPGEAVARSLLADAADLYAPSVIDFEVANAALKKIRAHPDGRANILSLHANYLAYPLEIRGIDQAACILLAHDQALSVYDASYLWLALEMKIDLVTLDAKLDKAWRKLVF